MLAGLDGANHRLAVELVMLADAVRGYEDRKLAAIEAYRTELAGRIAAFRAGAVAGPP